MHAGIENWFLKHWYGSQRPPWYLRMLEPVYRVLYRRDQKRKKSDSGVYRSPLPLIVVGNITTGGSGKTPLVIHLCKLALDMNLKPGIASTGYKRLSQETLLVEPGSDTKICGDEPVLLAQRTGVPVVVASNRAEAVKRLNNMRLDLLISDDGLQSADLGRDIDICVVDGERGLGNGHLLPAGPLREPPGRLRQVDHIVSNGIWADKPDGLQVSVMLLHATVVRSLDDETEYSVDQFQNQHAGTRVHAVAGIGNPQRFFDMLGTLGIKATMHGFADHHAYTGDDFDMVKSSHAIVMTEKDAVKCRTLGLNNAWYIPVETRLPEQFERMIKNQFETLTAGRK